MSIHKQDEIKKYSFVYSYPYISIDGKFNIFYDSAVIYFYKDCFLYSLSKEVTYLKIDSSFSTQSDSIFYTFEVIPAGQKEDYMVVGKNNDKYGYIFPSVKKFSITKKCNLDSFKNANNFTSRNLIPNRDSVILIDSLFKSKSKELKLIFCPIQKSELGDTLEYYMSEILKNNSFSLSETVDSIYNLKLWKFRVLYNEGYSRMYEVKLPKRELRIEFQEIGVDTSDAGISDFLSKFSQRKVQEQTTR